VPMASSCEESPSTGNSLGLPNFQTQEKGQLYGSCSAFCFLAALLFLRTIFKQKGKRWALEGPMLFLYFLSASSLGTTAIFALDGNICPTDAGANRFFCPVLMLQSLGFAGFLTGKAIMCFRVREFVAKLLQPHCSASIQSNSHYYSVATVILGFSVFAVNVIGHFSQNELLIYVSELLQFGMCISLLLLFVLVHIYMTRTSVCDAAASSFRKRRRLVHMAFAIVEITLLMRTIFWLYIAAALHNAPRNCDLFNIVNNPWYIPVVLFFGEIGSGLFCIYTIGLPAQKDDSECAGVKFSSPTASFSSTARQPLLGQGRTSFDFNSSDDAGISLTFG